MNTYTITTQPLFDQKPAHYVFFLHEGFSQESISKELVDLITLYLPNLFVLFRQKKFTGKRSDQLAIPIQIDGRIKYCIFVGIGKQDTEWVKKLELYRRAIGHAVQIADIHGCAQLAFSLIAQDWVGIPLTQLVEQTVIIANMSTYRFNEYLTPDDDPIERVCDIIICVTEAQEKEANEGLRIGSIISLSINKARHWVDCPPSDLTPGIFAHKAVHISQEHNLKCTVFSEEEIIAMGMGGLAGVSRGSDQDCKLVIMKYETTDQDAPTIAIVGKGITFDSGGLSLKPANYMETMKEDMSGAAAVIATMEAIAQLKPNVNVIGVTPLSENLPSGKATKPGDILRFYNGKTAEVKNTDAEGRLILADALSYVAKEYKPDAIIDLATLTGACSYALGPYYSGLMSQHDDLCSQIEDAAEISGDFVWRLPMGDDYKAAIKSDVADICNIGSPTIKAGAITAAHFLQHFVGDIPWAHLDIAGTAFDVPNISYYKTGATGVGVRLLVELLTNWERKE